MVTHVNTGSAFEAEIGYSRAVCCDGWAFVSGTTGYDYTSMMMPDAVQDQCANALKTISDALTEIGATLDDVVRVRYILPEKSDFSVCWPKLREAFGVAKPAATMISAELMNPEMKIEIEVTARIPA